MDINIRVKCIDDTNRPEGIPTHLWLTKDSEYTAIKLMKGINGLQGFKLLELNIDSCFPYQFFDIKRFAIHKDHLILLSEIESINQTT